MGEPFFSLPNSVESQQQSLDCAFGLGAASDVEGERERGGGGGGGELMRLDSDQSRTLHRSTMMDLSPLLPASPYRSVTECAHIHAFHLSISGPDLGQVSFLRLSLSGHRALFENL